MKPLLGFLTPWIVYLIITILHYALPGKWVQGYVRDSNTGELLKYRLNGFWVMIVSLGLWFLFGFMNWVPFDWLYQVRWYSLAGAFAMGIIYTLIVVLPHPSSGASVWSDLFLGRLENPHYLSRRVDAKMWLYLIGAVMLRAARCSFFAHHYLKFGDLSSPGFFIAAVMLSWFVFDYLTFERVHLYTYDLFAEKVGFKLGWGCLVFYPYFYTIPLWATADLRAQLWKPRSWFLLDCHRDFLLRDGCLARGANMQKYYFKTSSRTRILFGYSTGGRLADGKHIPCWSTGFGGSAVM